MANTSLKSGGSLFFGPEQCVTIRFMPRFTAHQAILGAILAIGMFWLAATPAQASIFDFFRSFTDADQNVKRYNKGVAEGVKGSPNLDSLVGSFNSSWQSSAYTSLLGSPDTGLTELSPDGEQVILNPDSQDVLTQQYGKGG